MKIKYILTMIMALALLLSPSQSVTAQTTPTSDGGGSSGGGSSSPMPNISSLPTGSVEILRAYALEQSAQVSAGLWSPSQVNGNDQYLYAEYQRDGAGTDPNKLLALLSSKALTLAVANTKDWCQSSASIHNKDGDNLFYAYNSFKLEKGVNGYAIPKGALNMGLRMADQIPLYLPGAYNVRIIERDASGNITRQLYLNSNENGNGKFYFPTYFASSAVIGGEVIVDSWDGEKSSSQAFGLKTGTPITTTSVTGTINASINGVVAMRNGNRFGHIYVVVTNGVPPTIVATFDQVRDSQVVIAVPVPGSVSDNGFAPSEYPTELLIRKEGTSDWTRVKYDPTSGGYPFMRFEVGTYYLVPVWKYLKAPQEYWPPYDGSSSGKG